MTTYEKFAAITPQDCGAQKASDVARDQAARGIGPGFATLSDVADYLRINSRSVRCILQENAVPLNAAGRVKWVDLWKELWLIPNVPTAHYSMMKHPLLSVTETASRVGVCAKSIIRDTDRKRPKYGLPRHVQLSKRNRRFHPEMILMWELNEALEDWMQPVASRGPQFRGLRPRLVASNDQTSATKLQSSDRPAGKGKNDNRSP